MEFSLTKLSIDVFSQFAAEIQLLSPFVWRAQSPQWLARPARVFGYGDRLGGTPRVSGVMCDAGLYACHPELVTNPSKISATVKVPNSHLLAADGPGKN